MKIYEVYRSGRFERELGKFDAGFHSHVDKIEEELKENPYLGKPLGTKWFREKKHGKYRIYFAVYEELDSVFMIAISGKKDQQKVIATVKLMFHLFRDELGKIIGRGTLT